jgi:hypothetical protein
MWKIYKHMTENAVRMVDTDGKEYDVVAEIVDFFYTIEDRDSKHPKAVLNDEQSRVRIYWNFSEAKVKCAKILSGAV